MNNTCDICNILNIFVKSYWTSLEMALYKWSTIIIIIIIIIIILYIYSYFFSMFRFKLVGKVLLWSFIYNIIPKHHQTTFYITYNTIFIVCHQNQQSCREGGGEGGDKWQ